MKKMSLSDIFEPSNIRLALLDLSEKKDSVGLDGMYLSDLSDFLLLNPNWNLNEEGRFSYSCGPVREYFVWNKRRKQRAIYQFNALDRLVARATEQVLESYLDPLLSDNCFSYREGKGVLDAVIRMKEFVEQGYDTILEFDVDDYFESIPHQRLLKELIPLVDDGVLSLLKSFMKVTIVSDGREGSYIKRKGLITGSAISPLLSNFFLRSFDAYIDQLEIPYVRYGDDYFLFFRQNLDAIPVWKDLEGRISEFGLNVNKGKSGIFSPFRKKILGYYFTKTKQGIIVDRPPSEYAVFNHWQVDSTKSLDTKFDIISDGILTQRQWNLLFDSERGKVHLPTNVVDYLNVYSDVVIDSRVIEILSQRGIRVNVMDKFGEKIACIEPAEKRFDVSVAMKQLEVYASDHLRLLVATEMEKSILHNMRSVLRYYASRREDAQLVQEIEVLTAILKNLSTARSINDLLMMEARGRQSYFRAYSSIVQDGDFHFVKRSRRPPKDAINAMISFGNTFLYNYISSLIHRSPLDIRFSFLHSANRREESLQLDIADIFKPILVDRTIFSLINRQEIRLDKHFEVVNLHDEEGIYLNAQGKRIFLRALKEKLRTVITLHGRRVRYSGVIRAEIYKLHSFLVNGDKYKGYRYTT
ncbi:TPA: CRISPR-associated endonuclease Cas1 [Streptococcus suis]